MTAVYVKHRVRELDDERIVTLSPSAFRTLMLLRLLAQIEDLDGKLPPLRQIAFRLRTTTTGLKPDFDELRAAGLLEGNPTWRLTTFAEEQGPVSGAERSRAWRERHAARET